jgi:CubicO group peptidase (beta-lactamase class C family)
LRFLDAALFALDQSVSTVFPEFAKYPEHSPTFRQCMSHQSSLKGHGSWCGVGNVWFDHVFFNGIETLNPTAKQKYSGDGFKLVGRAMQLLTGEPKFSNPVQPKLNLFRQKERRLHISLKMAAGIRTRP